MGTTSTLETSADARAAAATDHFIELQTRLLEYYDVQAVSRYLELDQPRMRVHLLDGGTGEPVVVLHGGDGEAVNWAPLLGRLQHDLRFYAVDRPGCGLSDAFDYRTVDLRAHAAAFVGSLLDAIGLDSVTIVGGSMGGYFALAGALAHPARVRRVVLVGLAAGAIPEIPESLQAIIADPALAEAFMRGRDDLEAQKRQYREMFDTDPAIVPDLYFETRIAGLRLPSEQGTWATLLPRLGTIYLGDDLHRMTAPTLVIWGEHDMSPADVGRGIAQRIPDGRFELLPGVGHFPFLEAPELTARLIEDFIRTS